MANSELSKLKILYIYDYFLRQVNAFDNDGGVTINQLLEYLNQSLGYTFERKSIYADISKINEYINKTHKIKGADSWISVEGKKYRKNQLEDEITVDEARLIVDAISTTSFTDTALCDKIEEMFPTYFDENYSLRTLYPHNGSVNHKSISFLNNIRSAIESRKVLKIQYGYMLGNDLVEKTDKMLSPMALDWDNNKYYLVAIDNEAASNAGKDLYSSLRRYRLDRIAKMSFVQDAKYVDFPNPKARSRSLEKFLNNSLSAYTSSDDEITLKIVISGQSHKDVLKAYNAFVTRVKPAKNINDTRLFQGELKLEFDVPNVPTLYTDLFEIVTFEGVDLYIENEDVRERFRQYLSKISASLT